MTRAAGPAHPDGTHQLSLNEMPAVPLAHLEDILRESLHGANRYPDPFSRHLTAAIADLFSVPDHEVVVGPGSAAILQHVIQWAAPRRGDEVIYARPAFDAYRLVVNSAGATPVEVPLKEHRHDLSGMLDSITPRTRALVLCNPHNPTGTALDTAAMLAFLREVPEHVVIVLDEAYHEFATGQDTLNGPEVYHDIPTMVVLRSFSKAYGLAGLRIGYALAARDVAHALRNRLLPFSVSTIAEAAARAALARRPEVLRQVDRVIAERGRLAEGLRHRGWDVAPSAANFCWLPLGSRSAAFAAAAARQGILVRAVGEEGVRITVGEPQATDALLRFAAQYAAESAGLASA
ncbi:histidinol-phosphate transaminase [Streptomyces sioyaensis]|uniref:histidinol-phosphate transaminase n=1 Tax=Streptomyces sioyaensis TaxID=67364 RepID=UPI001F026C3E|nr:histidinol-phosphate transaminase [Streptomyces sioyaensis]MCF3173822.1 histidinol-phosphate transaminase [Streptomyces sioyaensis]